MVNHSLGWFQCHACGVRRSATYDDSPATRFRAVLKQAAWSAHQTFPGVLPEDEARSHANERLAIYAGSDDGRWADSGALERWEKKAEDEMDSLDRFVLHALNCDLLDYGRKLPRQRHREKPVGDGQQSVTIAGAGAPDPLLLDHLTHLIDSRGFDEWEQLRDSGQFSQDDYPLLFATKVDLFTREELSEITGMPVSTIRNRLAEEKARMAAAL